MSLPDAAYEHALAEVSEQLKFRPKSNWKPICLHTKVAQETEATASFDCHDQLEI